MADTLEVTTETLAIVERAETLLQTIKPTQPKLTYNKQALLRLYKENIAKTQAGNALASTLKKLARFTGGTKESFVELESEFLAALQQSEEQLTTAYRDYLESIKGVRDMLAASVKGFKDNSHDNIGGWSNHLEQVIEQSVLRFHEAESTLSSSHRLQANFVAAQMNKPILQHAANA